MVPRSSQAFRGGAAPGRYELRLDALVLLLAVIGAFAGGIVTFLSPRLVAYRLESQPRFPSLKIVLPFIGPFWEPTDTRRSLAVQIASTVVLAGLAIHDGASTKLAIGCAYSIVLLTIAYIDVDYRLVLNRLTYPAIPAAVVLSTWWPSFSDYFHPLNAVVAAVTALLVFGTLQLIGRGALGTGDTKLAVLIGAMVGFPNVLTALLFGIFLGGAAGAFFLVVLRRGRKTYIAYAPYLALGAIVFLFTV